MLFKDSVGILKRSNGTHSLLVQGRTADNTTNSLIIQNSDSVNLLEIWNDGNIKLSETIGSVTIGNYQNSTTTFAVGGSSELIGTVDITGDTSITGDLDLFGSIQIQDGTESDGYVLTAGTNGNAVWQALPDTPTGVARTEIFTADGVTTNFTLTFDPIYVYYVSVNGVIQEEGVHYTINGVNLTFTDVLVDGYVIIVSYTQSVSEVNLTGVATDINYTPTAAGDWSPQPVDVQQGLDQLAANITSMNIGNTLFVTPTGDNATAVRGDMNHPYNTITGAKTAAGTNDLIIVYPGQYDEAVLAASGSVSTLYYFFLPGTSVVNTSTNHIFSIANTYNTFVYGSGYFESTDSNAAVAMSVSASTFYFEFSKCKGGANIVISAAADWFIKGQEIECTAVGISAVEVSGQFEVDKIIHNGSSATALSLAGDCNVIVKEIEANNSNGVALDIKAGTNNNNAIIQSITSVWRGFEWGSSGGDNSNIEIGRINTIDYVITNSGAGLSNSTININFARSTSQIAANIQTSGRCVFNIDQIISDTSRAIDITGQDTRDVINVEKAIGAADVAIKVSVSATAPSSGVANDDLELNVNETTGRIQITAANSTYFYLSLIVNRTLVKANDYSIEIFWESATQPQRLNLDSVRLRTANATASIRDAGGVSPEIAAFFCIADSEADASIINNGLPLVINSNV